MCVTDCVWPVELAWLVMMAVILGGIGLAWLAAELWKRR